MTQLTDDVVDRVFAERALAERLADALYRRSIPEEVFLELLDAATAELTSALELNGFSAGYAAGWGCGVRHALTRLSGMTLTDPGGER